MASRNKDKAQIAINELKEDTGNEAIFLPLDLASLASVRKGAEEFLRLAEWLFRLFCRNLIKVLFQQRARAPYIVQQWASGQDCSEVPRPNGYSQWYNVAFHRTSHGRWI